MPDNLSPCQRLRALADFYEAHPDLPLPHDFDNRHLLVFLPREKAVGIVRSLGTFRKQFDNDNLWFRAIVNVAGIELHCMTQREIVCQRKIVGRRQIPAQMVPEKYTPSQVIPAHEEEIVEWDCGPIMGESEEEAKAAHQEG